jgi:hypothetical protein
MHGKEIKIMLSAESLASVAKMHLIKNVDTARVAGDPFKLPVFIRTQHDADLDGLESADNSAALAEGDRAGGSAAARGALDQLQVFLKEGYKFIGAIRSSQITDAQRLEVFTEYGWAGGLMGRFGDSRVIGLSRLAVQAHPDIAANFCYPADLVADITAQLAVFDTNAPVATGGQRSAATHVRDAKLDNAKTSLAQVRFYYCSASRDTDQTPELAKIGLQPRRAAGTVTGNTKPAPAPAPEPK